MKEFFWPGLLLTLLVLQDNESLFVFELVEVSFSHLQYNVIFLVILWPPKVCLVGAPTPGVSPSAPPQLQILPIPVISVIQTGGK